MSTKAHFTCLLIFMALVMMTSVVARPTPLPRRRRPTSGDSGSRNHLLQQRLRNQQPKDVAGRLMYPCAGSNPVVDGLMEIPVDDTNIDWEFHRVSITTRVDQLVKEVDHLKKNYAEHRFKDTVPNLDQLGFLLDGMPKLAGRSRSDATLADLINQAISDLTGVIPFIESALDGELRYEHGHRHYTGAYHRLIDDPRHGLYTVLCDLTRVRSIFGTESAAAAALSLPADVSAVPGSPQVVNNAIRHYRDYIVLRDLRKLLRRLRTDLLNSSSSIAPR